MDEVKTCSEAVDVAMDNRKHAQRHDGRYRDVFDVTADDVEGRNSKKKWKPGPRKGQKTLTHGNGRYYERRVILRASIDV